MVSEKLRCGMGTQKCSVFTVKFIRKLLVHTIFIYSRLHLFTILQLVCNVCKLFVTQNVSLFVGPVGIQCSLDYPVQLE